MKRLLPALILSIFNAVAAASPDAPEVVRYDRYLLVSPSPQQPPLEQLTALSIPPGFHPTVGEALQYLLRGSGWSLCLADARRAQLYGLPLPLSQYHTGPLRLKAAWQRLYPGLTPLKTTSASTARVSLFVQDNCPPCDSLLRTLLAQQRSLDIWLVGSEGDDNRVRRWAMAHGIDAKLVSEHSITLNHDAGRWLLLGQSKIPVALERKGEQWREVQP